MWTIGLTIDQVLSAEGGNEPTEGASGEAGAQ
jgi:hypothetical protein